MTEPREIKAKLSPNLEAIFASEEDALIFAGTTATTVAKPEIFFTTYEAITGKRANLLTLQSYNRPYEYAEIIQRTKTSTGETLAEAMKLKD